MPAPEEVRQVELLIVLAVLVLVLLSATAAADTRDGNDWVNHRRI
jgi:hypothetical protein